MTAITYRNLKGYKYQLTEDYEHELPDTFPALEVRIANDFYSVQGRTLTARMGYCWDGPSGPTVDTHDFMRGSLVHDILYQMMREKELPMAFRDAADLELKRICIEDGMHYLRASYVYQGVHMFGEANARPREQ